MNRKSLEQRIGAIEKAVFGRVTGTPEDAILSIFEMNNRTRTEREIIQSRSCVSPFVDSKGNKSELVRRELILLVSSGKLKLEDGRYSLVTIFGEKKMEKRNVEVGDFVVLKSNFLAEVLAIRNVEKAIKIAENVWVNQCDVKTIRKPRPGNEGSRANAAWWAREYHKNPILPHLLLYQQAKAIMLE